MKATEFDTRFEDGEDIVEELDWPKGVRPNEKPRAKQPASANTPVDKTPPFP